MSCSLRRSDHLGTDGARDLEICVCFFFKQKTAYEILAWTGVQTCALPILLDWDTDRFRFMVNNAGIGDHASIAETTEAQFDQLMNIHVKGPFFLTQKLLPLMADGGRIVNVSTGLARFVQPGFAAYASAKGAVEVMTRYLALELGPRRIAVNAIAPGAIETDFGGGVVRDKIGRAHV